MHTLKQLQDGKLKDVTSVKISDDLKTFPRELFELVDTLEFLDLSHNHLSLLPDDFYRLNEKTGV